MRSVLIPKGDGRPTRPIGIPTLEDKVLPRAVVMVLVPIYTGFVAEVEPRLKGRAFLIRCPDDFVMGCANEEDARRVGRRECSPGLESPGR